MVQKYNIIYIVLSVRPAAKEWKFRNFQSTEISIVLHSLNGIPFMQVDISMEIDWNFHLQVSKVEFSIP